MRFCNVETFDCVDLELSSQYARKFLKDSESSFIGMPGKICTARIGPFGTLE